MNESVIHIKHLEKTYATGHHALKNVSLDIHKGEIFGLLGPNGAGKTTLISIIAGLTKKTSGEVMAKGHDVEKNSEITRRAIGLVQQEINADAFFSIEEMLTFQAGYYGIRLSGERMEEILKSLSLWEKRKANGRQLSGGMKRRVMIAKALVHDPEILFLDEPSAGVDVELRANLWQLIRSFKERGKTIVLTTHYLEEAEELADRIGIIFNGELILVEEKKKLIKQFGTEKIRFELNKALQTIPPIFEPMHPVLKGHSLEISYTPDSNHTTVHDLWKSLEEVGMKVVNIETDRTDLNDIYLQLIKSNHASPQ